MRCDNTSLAMESYRVHVTPFANFEYLNLEEIRYHIYVFVTPSIDKCQMSYLHLVPIVHSTGLTNVALSAISLSVCMLNYIGRDRSGRSWQQILSHV